MSYQPTRALISGTSMSDISMFSATFGRYWQAYLSEVCADAARARHTRTGIRADAELTILTHVRDAIMFL